MLASCTRSRNHVKIVTRHVWEDARDRVRERRLTNWGKEVYAHRKETVERSFADAKELHGQRYARMRGLDRVNEQCLLSAACQNMKKIVLAVFFVAFYGKKPSKKHQYDAKKAKNRRRLGFRVSIGKSRSRLHRSLIDIEKNKNRRKRWGVSIA